MTARTVLPPGLRLAGATRPTTPVGPRSQNGRMPMTHRILCRPGAARPKRLVAAMQVLGVAASLGLLSANLALAESPQPKSNEPTQDMPGGQSSGSANPQNLKTHRDPHGDVRTEDGRKVRPDNGDSNNRQQRDDSPEHSHPGGASDPSSDPGSTEP